MKRIIALTLLVVLFIPKPAHASYRYCEPDDAGRCSWSYELYMFGSCYGNGFLCWRTWI